MEYENETYQDEIQSEGRAPTGLKSKKQNKSAFLQSAQQTWNTNLQTP